MVYALNGCPDNCRGISLDHCPECGRHIMDFDMTGMEAESAQRWCLAHYSDQEYVRALRET